MECRKTPYFQQPQNIIDERFMIADLHCDLLLYLMGGEQRTPHDTIARCSVSQMRIGKVKLQTLPIFTETVEGSSAQGALQNNIFHALPYQYPEDFDLLTAANIHSPFSGKISVIRSVENASAFCEESEPLDIGLKRLQGLLNGGPLVYISLTWNTENRFGGGVHASGGLKDDGRELLNFMSGKRTAVDLSHTSDALAFDILDHIDKHNLDIPVLASHSNCRSVMNVPRNLPDSLIREIIRRGGIIGLNFVKPFLGPGNPQSITKHLAHLLELGGGKHVCFGADFFFEEDIPLPIRRAPGEYFFEEYGTSAAYPEVLERWCRELGLDADTLNRIAYGTAAQFIGSVIL